MSFGLRIDIVGDKRAERRLLRFEQVARRPEPALAAIADLLRVKMTKRFDSKGRLGGGGGWAPLAESTVAYKARHGLDPRILHATLRLRESLTGRTAESIEYIGVDSLVFGTNVPYAGFHQKGTSRMPARPPLALSEGNVRDITKLLQRWLLAGELPSGAGTLGVLTLA